MVPGDNERTSANKPENNTSTRGTFFEKLKFWKRCKQEDDEPAQLTPMPPCLMKWWTPLLIAFVLFALSLICALGWGWQWHWPSSNAMKLCMTITGAGFAFSAWQQRSHDNAANAKQARAAVEREDYWKRREYIFQLLGSENSRQRLAAVELLAELADSTQHSKLLSPSEIQQLHQYIINTLCLQLRHEGLLVESEGTNADHIEIQNEILKVIFKRIQTHNKNKPQANWSTETINFTNTHFYTNVEMSDCNTHCTIKLTGAVFHEDVTFTNCTVDRLIWSTSKFIKHLIFHSKHERNSLGTLIYHDNFPKYISYGDFNGITFCKEESEEGLYHKIRVRTSSKQNTAGYDDRNFLTFSRCTFLHPIGRLIQRSTSTKAFRNSDLESLDEVSLPTNYTWGTLMIEQIEEDNKQTSERDTDLKFDQCSFERVYIDSGLTHSNTEFKSCYFASQANITIKTANRSKAFDDQDRIIFDQCIFTLSPITDTPIKLRHIIDGNSGCVPRTFLQLRKNEAQTYADNGKPVFRTLGLTADNIGERQVSIIASAEFTPFEEITTRS